jgi:hypothetical protein
MMPAPSVFAERFAALEQVLAARRRRSQALVALASGRVTVEQVLESEDPAIGLTMVAAVLQTLRGIGAATAAVLLDHAELTADHRVAGLGPRQRARLLAAIDDLRRTSTAGGSV